MIKKLFLFFIFVPLAAFSSQNEQLKKIKSKGELNVCTTAGYAPFEVKTSKGKWVGFDIAMFETFTKRINVKLNMLDIRWEGIFPALFSNKCDFITGGMSITDNRKKVIRFSDLIYKSGNVLVISFRNKKRFKSLRDLDKTGIKIAVKTGNTGDFFLQKNLKNAKILRFDANSDMLTAVLENRADAFVQDSIFAFMASNRHKGKLVVLPEKLNYEDLAVGLRKQDIDLLNEFNSFLSDWKEAGGYDKAVSYYIESDEWIAELEK